VFLTKYYDDEIEEDEIGWRWRTHEREDRCTRSFGGKSLKRPDGRDMQKLIILKLTENKENGRAWAGFVWLKIGTTNRLL
jgi:hypothetical protein